MTSSPKKIPQDLKIWVDVRKRFRLSHAQIQMARELGLNPKKFGGLANHRQEPWKVPLPQFIEEIYNKRFKKRMPDSVRTIEEIAAKRQNKKLEKQAKKATNSTPPIDSKRPSGGT